MTTCTHLKYAQLIIQNTAKYTVYSYCNLYFQLLILYFSAINWLHGDSAGLPLLHVSASLATGGVVTGGVVIGGVVIGVLWWLESTPASVLLSISLFTVCFSLSECLTASLVETFLAVTSLRSVSVDDTVMFWLAHLVTIPRIRLSFKIVLLFIGSSCNVCKI